MENVYHIPAMLAETIEGLNIKPDGVYVDVTLGGGGHSREILKHLEQNGTLYSLDQDEEAIQHQVDVPANWHLVHSNFRYLANFMDYYGVEKIDGLRLKWTIMPRRQLIRLTTSQRITMSMR